MCSLGQRLKMRRRKVFLAGLSVAVRVGLALHPLHFAQH
jgi:hypothetical protein